MINQKVLSDKEREALVHRNGQLCELLKIDSKNRHIYEDELIENNIRLVSVVLKKYQPYTEDHFQIGCIGLINAAKTFDPERNVAFSNYACFLIERELHAAYKVQCSQFENQWLSGGGSFTALDEMVDVGGDSRISIAETISDEVAEFDFVKLLDDFQLSALFEDVIQPAMQKCIKGNAAQRKFDPDMWIKLETSYLLDLIDLTPLHERLSYTQMSKILGISIQNVKKKHQRLVNIIKEEASRRHLI